eukprot:scaffold19817_cov64-Phaeocystis_antarctica.AAC.4
MSDPRATPPHPTQGSGRLRQHGGVGQLLLGPPRLPQHARLAVRTARTRAVPPGSGVLLWRRDEPARAQVARTPDRALLWPQPEGEAASRPAPQRDGGSGGAPGRAPGQRPLAGMDRHHAGAAVG